MCCNLRYSLLDESVKWFANCHLHSCFFRHLHKTALSYILYIYKKKAVLSYQSTPWIVLLQLCFQFSNPPWCVLLHWWLDSVHYLLDMRHCPHVLIHLQEGTLFIVFLLVLFLSLKRCEAHWSAYGPKVQGETTRIMDVRHTSMLKFLDDVHISQSIFCEKKLDKCI